MGLILLSSVIHKHTPVEPLPEPQLHRADANTPSTTPPQPGKCRGRQIQRGKMLAWDHTAVRCRVESTGVWEKVTGTTRAAWGRLHGGEGHGKGWRAITCCVGERCQPGPGQSVSTSSALCEWTGFFKGYWWGAGGWQGFMEKQELQRLCPFYWISLMGKDPQHQALPLHTVGRAGDQVRHPKGSL